MNQEDQIYSRCGNCHAVVTTRTCDHCGFISSKEGFKRRAEELEEEVNRYLNTQRN